MNQYKKNETALYITLATFIIAVGAVSGDVVNYALAMTALFGLMGITYGFFKGVVYILNRLYPENKTTTLGGKTLTVSYNCNEEQR